MVRRHTDDFGVTPAAVERYMLEARQMQADYIARGMRHAFRKIGRVFTAPGGTLDRRGR